MLYGVVVKNNIIQTTLILATCFIVGIVLGKNGLEYYESNTFKPWSWDSAPVVINCYGKEFNQAYIARGVDYWITRGEEISFVESSYIPSACKPDSIDGFIILKKASRGQLKDSTLAQTERRTSVMKGMISATIYFQPGAYKLDYIIEHELGHAFGYTHVDIEGHIMHPSFNMMSNKFWIP